MGTERQPVCKGNLTHVAMYPNLQSTIIGVNGVALENKVGYLLKAYGCMPKQSTFLKGCHLYLSVT